MSTMNDIREGFSRAWDSLAAGWQELRDMAGDAITRFHPKTPSKSDDVATNAFLSRSARWGILPAEVADTGKRIEVTLEIPGLDAGDFDIQVVGDTLIVRGEKKLSRRETRGHYHVTERAYGRFERAIRLPAAVDEDTANAKYRAGVLTVKLPKVKQSLTRRIAVESN